MSEGEGVQAMKVGIMVSILSVDPDSADVIVPGYRTVSRQATKYGVDIFLVREYPDRPLQAREIFGRIGKGNSEHKNCVKGPQ
jgi:hypothetical protein